MRRFLAAFNDGQMKLAQRTGYFRGFSAKSNFPNHCAQHLLRSTFALQAILELLMPRYHVPLVATPNPPSSYRLPALLLASVPLPIMILLIGRGVVTTDAIEPHSTAARAKPSVALSANAEVTDDSNQRIENQASHVSSWTDPLTVGTSLASTPSQPQVLTDQFIKSITTISPVDTTSTNRIFGHP